MLSKDKCRHFGLRKVALEEGPIRPRISVYVRLYFDSFQTVELIYYLVYKLTLSFTVEEYQITRSLQE